MRKIRRGRSRVRPFIRLRSMLGGIVVIMLLIAGPLLMVWKQVYINSASIRLQVMTDSLSVLSREITMLRLRCERLASKERIESIAQSALGLEHTPAERIFIVKIPATTEEPKIGWPNEVVAFLRKSLLGDRS